MLRFVVLIFSYSVVPNKLQSLTYVDHFIWTATRFVAHLLEHVCFSQSIQTHHQLILLSTARAGCSVCVFMALVLVFVRVLLCAFLCVCAQYKHHYQAVSA